MEKVKKRLSSNKNIKHERIKAKLGLTDRKNHNVFYLEGGVFITPNSEFDNFVQVMDDIRSLCKQSVRKKIFNNDILEPVFLMNFEICSDRMKVNKNSYLSFQYHFKQKNNESKNVLNLKRENEIFFIDILNDIENKIMSYDMTLSKKPKRTEK